MMKFIVSLIFKQWTVFDFVVSLASFIALAFDSLTPGQKVAIVLSGIGLAFCIKLIRQCWHYYQGFLKPIKVIGTVKGVGTNRATTYIRIQNLSYLRPEMLLTMVTNGNGILQDLCVLQVVTSDEGQDCLCVTLNSTDQKLVESYCADGNKLSNLFAVPTINRPSLLTPNT
ncbi:MAG: hypothetical protein QY325_00975 [Flavobacteriales bacterium]|nr:MAG: hypothetical protein QY325_00975 [Flavobacteriales bacterium]